MAQTKSIGRQEVMQSASNFDNVTVAESENGKNVLSCICIWQKNVAKLLFIYMICRSWSCPVNSTYRFIFLAFKSFVSAWSAVFWSFWWVLYSIVVTVIHFKFLHFDTTSSQNRTRFINWNKIDMKMNSGYIRKWKTKNIPDNIP